MLRAFRRAGMCPEGGTQEGRDDDDFRTCDHKGLEPKLMIRMMREMMLTMISEFVTIMGWNLKSGFFVAVMIGNVLHACRRTWKYRNIHAYIHT